MNLEIVLLNLVKSYNPILKMLIFQMLYFKIVIFQIQILVKQDLIE